MSTDRESTSPPSHPLSRDTTTTLSSTTNPGTPTPGDFDREESPLIPDKPHEPPSSIRLHSLPVPSRRALSTVSTSGEEQQTRSREVLMPVTTRGGGVNIPAASPAKQEEKKGLARPQGDPDKPKGKETAPPLGAHKMSDSVEYAYEYVPVVQTREGRDKINYEMIMRQEPVQARMCGVGEKSDRRPVDPTPIVQLKVTSKAGDDLASDSKGDGEKSLRRPEPGPNGASFMQNPYYFLFACLVGGDEQDDELHVIDDGKTRFLTGTPVSSLYHLKDTDQSDAAFFVFPDLGVRKEGRYKLKLTLFEIVDQEVFYCTTKYTATFDVYSAKKFPGMKRATELSATFADQGLKIRVRKDPRQRSKLPKSKRKSSGNDSQSETSRPLSKRSRGPQTRAPVPVFPEHQRYPDPVHNPYVNPPRPYPSVTYLGRNMPPPPIPGELPRGQYSPYPPGYGVYGGAAYQQEVTSRQRPATSFHPGYSDEAYREQEARQHRSRGEVYQTHPSVPWPQSQSQPYGRPTSASTSRTRPLTGPPADGRVYGSPMDYPRSPVQMNGHGPRPIYQDQISYGHHPRSPSSNYRREPSPSHGPPPRSAPPFEHYHMRQPDGPPSAGPTSRDRIMHGPPALPTFYARQDAEDGAPGVSPRLAPSPYTSPSGTKQASAKSSVVLPSISTLHSPMPVPIRTDSMGKISSDSAANSPATTPGGTRPTNKMGLGHLVD